MTGLHHGDIIHDNCRYSLLDDQEEDCDKSLLRNRATPATDQNRGRRTSIYEMSVRRGSHWLGPGEIFYYVNPACNAQHGIRMELNRGSTVLIGADIPESLYDHEETLREFPHVA